MSRAGVIDTIAAHLEAVTTPTFQAVLRTEPLKITATPTVAFSYIGDSTLQESLGDVQIEELFLIRAYWRMEQVEEYRVALELEVWNANRAIQAALRGDSTLGGNCTDLKIDEARAGYVTVAGALCRMVEIPIRVWIYESESIAP